jgi:hypothetical protein
VVLGAPGHAVGGRSVGVAYQMQDAPLDARERPVSGGPRLDAVRTFGNLDAGTYCWTASYSGDAVYAEANATQGCFRLRHVPEVAFEPQPGRDVAPGAAVWLNATFAGPLGAVNVSGEATVLLCDPGQSTAAGCFSPQARTAQASSIDEQARMAGATLLAGTRLGRACWRVEYAGDAFYHPVSATGGAACFNVTRQRVAVRLDALQTARAPWDAQRADAIVSGDGPAPTGSVAFRLCGPTEIVPGVGCPAGAGRTVGSLQTLAGGLASAGAEGLFGPGRLCWALDYGGDAYYSSGSFGDDASACFETQRQPAHVGLSLVGDAQDALPWTPVGVRATVTGNGPLVPGGHVRLLRCDGLSKPACPEGALVGPGGDLAQGVALLMPSAGVVRPGVACLLAHYEGDDYHLEERSASPACHLVSAGPAAIVARLVSDGAPAPGKTAALVVRVSSPAGAATGDVSFRLCAPHQLSPGPSCQSPDAPAAGPAKALSGGAAVSAHVTLTLAGTHCFRVEYSGDALHAPGALSSGDACFTAVPFDACPARAGAHRGGAVALGGGRAYVGLWNESSLQPGEGLVCVFDAETGAFLETFLDPVPRAGGAGDGFGYALSYQDGLLAVGAPFSGAMGKDSGLVRVFDASTGALRSTLSDPMGAAGDRFGWSVAFAGDRVLVGAPGVDLGAPDAGAVFSFDARTGALVGKMGDPTPAPGNGFGWSLAGNATVALVGSPFDDAAGRDAGAAHVLDLASGRFLRTYLPTSPGGRMGWSVGLAGPDAVAGAPQANATAGGAGAVYVFAERAPENATAGALKARLTAAAPRSGAAFGWAVAASATRIVVGAPGNDTGRGALAVYDASNLSSPSPLRRAVDGSGHGDATGPAASTLDALQAGAAPVRRAAQGVAFGHFGAALALSGGTLLAGAPDRGGDREGAAYLLGVDAGDLRPVGGGSP